VFTALLLAMPIVDASDVGVVACQVLSLPREIGAPSLNAAVTTDVVRETAGANSCCVFFGRDWKERNMKTDHR